jgi:AraC family transcriptional regulator
MARAAVRGQLRFVANAGDSGFKGILNGLRGFAGVEAVHVQHAGRRHIPEHAHDWPNLTIPLLGHANEAYETAKVRLSGGVAVFHPAGGAHSNQIGACGLDTLGLLFDPDWLGIEGARPDLSKPVTWQGGRGAALARQLARLWMRPEVTEAELRCAIVRLLSVPARTPNVPAWLPVVQDAVAQEGVTSTRDLARRVGLHPAWLAHAYRRVTGQGLQESLRMQRLECAVAEVRNTQRPLTDISHAAGFCDQAHMHRWIQALLGKTPGQLRAQAADNRLAPAGTGRNQRNLQSAAVRID